MTTDSDCMTDDRIAPILTIRNLQHAYGQTEVLSGVSLDVRPGEVTAIVGPNGAGKTTLVRALVGLHDPTGGEIQYAGPSAARPIGYLQQRPAFRPGETVRDTLGFYASLVGAADANVLARLEQVGLEAAADRNVEALSGGMTRLAGIAQAMVGSPPIVVLDEPASGLDPQMSVRIFEVAEELAADGTAVVMTSHDLELVERTANRVALLDSGEIVLSGSPAEIRTECGTDTLLEAFETAVSGDAGTVSVRGETA